MTKVVWTAELEIGIPVIDGQHRQIVNHINVLDEVCESPDRGAVARVMGELVDYTYSHFAFEEALMEEAGYEAVPIHRRSHDAFRERIDKLHNRFGVGEDVAAELAEVLRSWLLHHIRSDDSSYAPVVKRHLADRRHGERRADSVLSFLTRLFRRETSR